MSFRIEKIAPRNSSFATPGEKYRILASSATLHKSLSDSYWCEAMEQVCGGQLEGVAVRYTGESLVMMQFLPAKLSPAGYRYPLYVSIPIDFMVPVEPSAVNIVMGDLRGSFGSATTSASHGSSSSDDGKSPTKANDLPKLCVVCGRYNIPMMVLRHHGWKCKECKGKKYDNRLREEVAKLKEKFSKK